MSPAKMKRQAECMGECVRDCKEDCSDPEVDEEDRKDPVTCGAECDKDCFDQCEEDNDPFGDGDQDDEVSDGRPGPKRADDEEVPRWNEMDEDDDEELSDGSGKGVQQATPPQQREMDHACLRECTPTCLSECEVDKRDAEEGASPAMAQGPRQCRKDCKARCEDDCYIDDGGMSPEAEERHRIEPSDEDQDGETNMPPEEGGPMPGGETSEMMDPRDRKLHKMLESCVDGCQGDCMGKCLSKAGLGMLPLSPLDPEELQNIRDKRGRPLPPKAVNGHLFCSEGCSGDCFQLCERQVSRQMASAAARQDGGMGRDEGPARRNRGVAEGRGGRKGARARGGGYGYGRDTVVLPKADNMLFGSTLWRIGVGAICLATLALGAWSFRRVCMGKGRARGAPMTPV